MLILVILYQKSQINTKMLISYKGVDVDMASSKGFSAVYAQGDPGNGIGGFDLKSALYRAFAYDYDGSGKLDHIALYRPGTGTMWIEKEDAKI